AKVRSHGGTRSGNAPVVTTRVPFAAPRIRADERARPAARWLHQVFEATCDTVPSAIALEHEQTRLTYRELDVLANRLAHHLRDRGAGRGARVMILLQRSIETYVALLGIGKAGA